MTTSATLRLASLRVVRNPHAFEHLERLQCEAAAEMERAFEGVSGKRIDAAGLPGFSRHGISRAANGSDTNPLYRIAGLLLVMKRLGMGRERALRWLEWLRQVVDWIWPPEEEGEQDLRAILDHDATLDGQDELPRQRAYAGDREAMRLLLEVKTAQIAVEQATTVALRRTLATEP